MAVKPNSPRGVRAGTPPMSLGATTAATSWIQPCRIAAAANSGPHSQSTRLQPRFANSCIKSSGSEAESTTRCGPEGNGRSCASGPWATRVEASDVSQSWAVSGSSMLRLSTTRRGSGFRRPRLVSNGSSARTVPPPTITASDWERSRCAHCRAVGPLIHWLSPLLKAVRPSRPIAHLSVPQGRPVRTRCRKARF